MLMIESNKIDGVKILPKFTYLVFFIWLHIMTYQLSAFDLHSSCSFEIFQTIKISSDFSLAQKGKFAVNSNDTDLDAARLELSLVRGRFSQSSETVKNKFLQIRVQELSQMIL